MMNDDERKAGASMRTMNAKAFSCTLDALHVYSVTPLVCKTYRPPALCVGRLGPRRHVCVKCVSPLGLRRLVRLVRRLGPSADYTHVELHFTHLATEKKMGRTGFFRVDPGWSG